MNMWKNITNFVSTNTERIVVILAVVLSIASFLWSNYYKYSLIYNDAMAHLNIARLVVDSMQPGLVQLGTVWLPLNHVLALLFVWNDWFWQSGLSGIVFSMISYVVSVWGIYAIAKGILQDKVISFVAAMIFALNGNILYLQATPLTEPLYLTLLILSTLVFVRWIYSARFELLVLLGALGFLQVLTRYDGWFFVFTEGFLVFFRILTDKGKLKYSRSQSFVSGEFLVFFLPVFLSVSIWVVYNWLIFGNPLAFALGDGSAHSQQADISQSYGLATKYNFLVSLETYFFTVLANEGVLFLSLSILGSIGFLLAHGKSNDQSIFLRVSLIALLFSPIVFNVLALYFGFSTINIPFQYNYSNFSSDLFNVRYGIMALPFCSLMVAFLMSYLKNKVYRFLVGILIFSIIFYQLSLDIIQKPVSLQDGLFGLSSFTRLGADLHVADILRKDFNPKEDKMLVSMGSFNSILFEVGFDMNSYLYEGLYKCWDNALRRPEEYVVWILMRENDLVDKSLSGEYNSHFLQYYNRIYTNNDVSLFRMRDEYKRGFYPRSCGF